MINYFQKMFHYEEGHKDKDLIVENFQSIVFSIP